MTPERAALLLRESEPVAFEEQRLQAVERHVLDELRSARTVSRAPAATPSAAWSRPLTGAVAGLALAAAILLLVLRSGSHDQQLQLSLKDGSQVISLSAGAHVLPELVADNRVELRQTAGSLAYDVTPRPGRMFVVRVADARVEVLGTAFRIDLSQQAIHVAVTRGRVRVVRGNSSAELAAGEEVTLASPAPAGEAERGPQAESRPTPSADAPVPSPVASSEDGPSKAPASPSAHFAVGAPAAAELFLRADQARQAGDSASALRHLRELLRTHPKDGRATLARFTIGRLESARGNALAAAEAFESCGSALSGEAIAEAALARAAAGQADRAKALAARYLLQFPNGPRAGALQKLAR